jgi:hypothetical protein
MTSLENLPVWAKILLGIPVNDAVLPKREEPEEQANSSKREVSVYEFAQTEQTGTAYNRNQWESKWNRRGGFWPAMREAS